jgi:hypothetical protein
VPQYLGSGYLNEMPGSGASQPAFSSGSKRDESGVSQPASSSVSRRDFLETSESGVSQPASYGRPKRDPAVVIDILLLA